MLLLLLLLLLTQGPSIQSKNYSGLIHEFDGHNYVTQHMRAKRPKVKRRRAQQVLIIAVTGRCA